MLGYARGHGNYKVQDIISHCVFVSRDIIFEEGEPHRTSPSVGERDLPIFDTTFNTERETLDEGGNHPNQSNDQQDFVTVDNHMDRRDIPADSNQQMEPNQQTIRRSSRIYQPSSRSLQSKEYLQCEEMGQHKGEEWTGNQQHTQGRITINSFSSLSDSQDDYIACLAETKALHNIPHSY